MNEEPTSVRLDKPARAKKKDLAQGVPRERIIDAAYRCFERFGVQKTTMDDIAGAAACSRQTVYNNFPNKEDVVTQICLLEWEKMNLEIAKSVRLSASLIDKITDSIMVALRYGTENPYIRRLMEMNDVRKRAIDKNDALHATQRERWLPLLEAGLTAGEVATDLDIDEIVSWLTLAQVSLLIKFDQQAMDEAEVNRFVRRFVVPPILAQR